MKKIILILAVFTLTVALSNDMFAQGGKNKNQKQYRTNFVDADGDGVCDNIGTQSKSQGVNFVDADGDGVCDNEGTCTSNGERKQLNFVDANSDGICDNTGLPISELIRQRKAKSSNTKNRGGR